MLTQQEFDDLLNGYRHVLKAINVQDLETRKAQLSELTNEPGFWDDTQAAGKVNKEIAQVDKEIAEYRNFETALENLQAAFDLGDDTEFSQTQKVAQEGFDALQLKTFLSGRFDSQPVLMSIHAGAGGVDAQDWAAMVTAMYQGFCKVQGWSCEIIDLSPGEEGGLKSVTMKIEGQYTYGLLKEEAGVHRLVRLSPFNAGHTRETSFALVEVMPAGMDEELELPKIEEKDVRWDYFMASGKGGQSVNTTYSAVRVVHIPTGLSVSCQNERSQVQNKQQALKYLQNKLAVLELQKQKDLKDELKGAFQSAEFGSQIRNYVLHPYKLVKDVRSGFEVSDPDAVLEGQHILDFIWAYKKFKVQESAASSQ
jgi:peptide chain release factor 2